MFDVFPFLLFAATVGNLNASRGATLAQVFSDADYPVEAMFKEEQGTTAFRLTIGTAGTVDGCSIVKSSGSASLDAQTCDILIGRARFSPARDAQGRPVGESYEGRVRWVLPEPESEPVSDHRMLAQITADSKGSVRDCKVTLWESGRLAPSQPEATDCAILSYGIATEITPVLNRMMIDSDKTLTIDREMIVGVPPANAPAIHLDERQQVEIAHLLTTFTAGPDGSVLMCRTTVLGGVPGSDRLDPCVEMRRRKLLPASGSGEQSSSTSAYILTNVYLAY